MARLTPGLLILLLAVAPASAQQALPNLAETLGFTPGTDGRLPTWARLLGYYKALAQASPRVALLPLGKSTEGRELIALAISSAANIRDLQANRQRSARLADPRGLTAEVRRQLIRQTRMTVLIGCNLHSNETASSLTAAVLARALAVEKGELYDKIRGEVITLLVPSLNPDGLDIVTRWYRSVKGTKFVTSPMPHLYHRYAGHDNNRDWFMLTQPETRHVTRLMYKQYFPQVLLDIHEMSNKGARFFVPPFVDPVDPNIDPMLLRSIDLFGNHMALDLARRGKRGVVQSVLFDSWWQGGMRNTPWRHNVVGILTEAARVDWATPVFIKKSKLKGHGRGMPSYKARYNFPDPWPGGWWRIGDIIEYQQIAAISLLKLSAHYRQTLLDNYVSLGERAVRRGQQEGPYAFVMPHTQHDPAAFRRLQQVLLDGGVELHRATEPFTLGGRRYAAGSTVVRMSQPYRAHAKSLLERQRYPELKLTKADAPRLPYDISGWTLPLMLGVDCQTAAKPFPAKLEKIENLGSGRAAADRTSPSFLLPARNSASYRAVNLLLADGIEVQRLTSTGDFWLPNKPGLPLELLEGVAEPHRTPDARRRRKIEAPRLGLYQPSLSSMDEGWTRWVLDQAVFSHRRVANAQLKDLRASLDVLILPSLSARAIEKGSRHPLPKKYAGGAGTSGLAAIKRFVERGGTLICLNRSCKTAIDLFELKVTNILTNPENKKAFDCPGSILRAQIDTAHPIGFGSRPAAALIFSGSPVFDAREGTVVVRYPEGAPLLSGYLKGGRLLPGKAAVLVVSRGKGRIVLFGCRPQFRGQPSATFKWLYNAIWLGR